MKKRIIALVGAATLTLSMTLTVSAALPSRYGYGNGYGYSNEYCRGGYSLMWDQDGSFLDKEAFEANLDEAIENGLIEEEDRDFFLENYDYCAEYGSGFRGGRGRGCCGRAW